MHGSSHKIATPAAASGFAMTDNNNNHMQQPNQLPYGARVSRVSIHLTRIACIKIPDDYKKPKQLDER
jgi:hypothetical protein